MKRLLPYLATFSTMVLLSAQGAITVTGLTSKAYYLNSVTFTIQKEAGFTYTAKMDGVTISASGSIKEGRFGYHELSVTKRPSSGGTGENRIIQFIVKDGGRAGGQGNDYPEAGIGRWTPLRSIDAPVAVLDTTTLEVVTPPIVPANFPLPVIARMTDGTGKGVRIMGTMNLTGATAPDQLRLFRGAGSKVMLSPAASGAQTLVCSLGSRTFNSDYTVDAAPAWQTLSGASGGRTFLAGSFVNVTGDVTVAAGTSLTFGAGCVVCCGQGVSFDVRGTLTINGTSAQPVLFAPQGTDVWGGIWVHGASAVMHARYAILTGGGADPSWMAPRKFHAHRGNEPLFTWSDSAKGFLEDCFIIENPKGQALHGEDSISSANPFEITNCLIQKTITGGQIHNCSLVFDGNHIVETPRDEASFTSSDATSDFDSLYCDGGSTIIRNSVFGWSKDDGIDVGTGSTSSVNVSNCWFESCFHEGMAWSEGGNRTITDTVAMNNGQGLECGFTNSGAGTPVVSAKRVYLTGNWNGIRYGDNYDWIYGGKLDVHDSLSLFNVDDVFGIHWGSLVGQSTKNWAYIGKDRAASAYMHLEALPSLNLGATIVSVQQSQHASLPIWTPTNSSHLAILDPFLTSKDLPSGYGVAQNARQFARASYGGSVAVRLDRPAGVTRNLPWEIIGNTTTTSEDDTVLASGTLEMVAGRQANNLVLPTLTGASGYGVLTLVLSDSTDCIGTGPQTVTWFDPPVPIIPPAVVLLPRSTSGWKYYAKNSSAPAAWKTPVFDDTTWSGGITPLRTGEPALTGTSVPGNPANLHTDGARRPFNTVYCRKSFEVTDKSQFDSLTLRCMRDDGVVIYLNGVEIKRDNMPATGSITYNTSALISPDFESTYRTYANIPLTNLIDGSNVIAVEVHQFPIPASTHKTTSSDMRMDLEVAGQPPAIIP